MTTDEFNEKYKDYLEEGHYGLAIELPNLVEALDGVFQDLIKLEGFKYSQIKCKFGSARVYFQGANHYTNFAVECLINEYLVDNRKKLEKELKDKK